MDELIRQNVVNKTRLPRRIHLEEPPLVSLDDLKSLLKELPEPSRSIAALIVLSNRGSDPRSAEAEKRNCADLLLSHGNCTLPSEPAQPAVPTGRR
jgi:hypothetical protein